MLLALLFYFTSDRSMFAHLLHCYCTRVRKVFGYFRGEYCRFEPRSTRLVLLSLGSVLVVVALIKKDRSFVVG